MFRSGTRLATEVAMDGLVQDLLYAVRGFRRSAAFTTTALATLALGIGANTAIFTLVNGVLLRPLPYRESERLVAVFTDEGRPGTARNPSSPADVLNWQEHNAVFDDPTAARPWSPTLTGKETPDRLDGLLATPALFRLLGVGAALGRTFSPEESGERVVVLSHKLWQRRFGAEPGIVGEKILLDGEPCAVIGVMPPGFQFPPFWATEAELWATLDLRSAEIDRGARFLRVFARLKPGVGLIEAQAEMQALSRRLSEAHPQTNAGVGVNVEPLLEPVVSGVRPALWILSGAVGFVLLIACANVANLLLARGEARVREIAVRRALGAGRLRLVRQLLSESLLLSVAGGALGLLLASWATELLTALGPRSLPRLDEIRPDFLVFLFAFTLSLLTGVGFGLVPALRVSRFGGALTLRGAGRSRTARLLIVSEVALALVLLAGAGLLIKSFVRLAGLHPGFRTENLLTLTVSFSGTPHAEPSRQDEFFREIVSRVGTLPGVKGVALTNHLPIGGDIWNMPFTVVGRPAPRPEEVPKATFRAVSPTYFRTLEIPLLQGRTFGAEERSDSSKVVVVNETLARGLWPGTSPVGERLTAGRPDAPLTVVGVVGDARQWSLSDPVRPEIYFPYSQNPTAFYTSTSLVVQAELPVEGLAVAVKESIWSIDRDLPITAVRTMEQILDRDVAERRFQLWLLALFAGIALALAAVGIYGLVAFAVGQRSREFGIRMALGARPRDLLALVVAQGMALAVAGLVIGLGGALALGRYLSALLFEVRPSDPATLALVAAVLAAVAFVACYIPARRASRVDPAGVLRHE